MTPKYRASSDGWIVTSPTVTGELVLCVLFLVKWTRMYLDVSNLAPCLDLHCSASCNRRSSVSAFSSSVGPCAPENAFGWGISILISLKLGGVTCRGFKAENSH